MSQGDAQFILVMIGAWIGICTRKYTGSSKMTFKEKVDYAALWLCIALCLVGIWGWVANIVALVRADDIGGMEIFRMAGIIIAPLGVIVGYM